jgi:hypothetical protein
MLFLATTQVLGLERVIEAPVNYQITNEYIQARDDFSKKKNEAKSKDEKNIINLAEQEWIDKFNKHVKNLNETYSDEELKKTFNYEDSQVAAIRNFDGSEELSILASATYTGSVAKSTYYYDAATNKTYLTMKYTTLITGSSLNTTNNAAASIGGSEANYFHTSSSLIATYTSINGSENKTITKKEISSGNGVTFSFNNGYIELIDPLAETYVTYNLSKTVVTYAAVAGGRVSVSGIEGAFLTHTLSLDFGASFGKGSVGISITPKFSWTQRDKKTLTVSF